MRNKLSIITRLGILLAVTAMITAFTAWDTTSAGTASGPEKIYGGGAVEIYAGANLRGCVTGNGVSIPFTTNGSGIGYVSGLSAGTYSICVMNWGATTFYTDGASEIPVTVPNNVDCTC